jgi:hypothetical protein
MPWPVVRRVSKPTGRWPEMASEPRLQSCRVRDSSSIISLDGLSHVSPSNLHPHHRHRGVLTIAQRVSRLLHKFDLYRKHDAS